MDKEIKRLESKPYIHIDPKVLDRIARHSHNRRFPRELVTIFINDIELLFERFAKAIEDEDLQQVRFLAHRIRGSALNVGAQSMASVSSEIEKSAAKALNGPLMARLFRQLKLALPATAAEFDRLLKSP